jgi:hypothetical protein
MSRQDDVQKLIYLYTRRLQKLREKEAAHGLNTPPDILIDIEDIEQKIEMLQFDLQEANAGSTTATPTQKMSDEEIQRELGNLAPDDKPTSNVNIGGVNFGNTSGGTINIGGNVQSEVSAGGDIVGGDKIVNQTGSNAAQEDLVAALVEWRQELDEVLAKAADLDEDDKTYVEKTAAKLEKEAKKGEDADPVKMENFFKKMGNMAPDIIEVTAKTLQNPFAGVGLVLEKINDRIKLERTAKTD